MECAQTMGWETPNRSMVTWMDEVKLAYADSMEASSDGVVGNEARPRRCHERPMVNWLWPLMVTEMRRCFPFAVEIQEHWMG